MWFCIWYFTGRIYEVVCGLLQFVVKGKTSCGISLLSTNTATDTFDSKHMSSADILQLASLSPGAKDTKEDSGQRIQPVDTEDQQV